MAAKRGDNTPPVYDWGGLDWSGNRTGPAEPCRICGNGAFMRDHNGDPCHKVCGDAEFAANLQAAVARNQP